MKTTAEIILETITIKIALILETIKKLQKKINKIILKIKKLDERFISSSLFFSYPLDLIHHNLFSKYHL